MSVKTVNLTIRKFTSTFFSLSHTCFVVALYVHSVSGHNELSYLLWTSDSAQYLPTAITYPRQSVVTHPLEEQLPAFILEIRGLLYALKLTATMRWPEIVALRINIADMTQLAIATSVVVQLLTNFVLTTPRQGPRTSIMRASTFPHIFQYVTMNPRNNSIY